LRWKKCQIILDYLSTPHHQTAHFENKSEIIENNVIISEIVKGKRMVK
jgi:hypothetical protein